MAIPPYKAPSRTACDVVIVGGAAVGSSAAYWLSQALGRRASILVVERDSSCAFLLHGVVHQRDPAAVFQSDQREDQPVRDRGDPQLRAADGALLQG